MVSLTHLSYTRLFVISCTPPEGSLVWQDSLSLTAHWMDCLTESKPDTREVFWGVSLFSHTKSCICFLSEWVGTIAMLFITTRTESFLLMKALMTKRYYIGAWGKSTASSVKHERCSVKLFSVVKKKSLADDWLISIMTSYVFMCMHVFSKC